MAARKTKGWIYFNEAEKVERTELFGYPGYKITIDGRIISYHRSKPVVLRPRDDGHGYLFVNIRDENGKTRFPKIHKLVAKMYVPGEAPGLQVDHIDRNKNNNSARNLRWVTVKENMGNSMRATGMTSDTKKLIRAQARKLHRLGGFVMKSQIERIARGYSLHPKIVHNVIREFTFNYTWSN